MNPDGFWRRVIADLSLSAPEAQAEPVPRPKPDRNPPEARVLGYVAVTRRNGWLLVVSSVMQGEEQARQEAGKWAADDVHGAFVAELREVTS